MNTPRTSEIREALQELAELACSRAVDLVIVAGDLYDSKNPSAEAEEAVYAFFLKLLEAKIPSVVIAGNHDGFSRFEAARPLLQLTGAHVLGEVRVARQGGAFSLAIAGETVQVAALPFISERRIVRYAHMLDKDAGQWLEHYQQGMRTLINNLSASFSGSSINLLILHAMMENAQLARSEYSFHCSDSYALKPDILPHTANYVALGHVHKAQSIPEFPSGAARYCGSLIQLDFGEEGQAKYAYILEAQPGRPTQMLEEYRIQAGKPLRQLGIDLRDDENKNEHDKDSAAALSSRLERQLAEVEDFPGYLKLHVKLSSPRPGLRDRIVKRLPNALAVVMDTPRMAEPQEDSPDPRQVELQDAYRQFYLEERGQEPPPRLVEALKELLEQHSIGLGE